MTRSSAILDIIGVSAKLALKTKHQQEHTTETVDLKLVTSVSLRGTVGFLRLSGPEEIRTQNKTNVFRAHFRHFVVC